MITHYKVDYKVLEDYCKDIFIGFGVPADDAGIVASSLVDADLRNVISHGVVRVSNYINRLKSGGTNPTPHITVVSETPTTAILDGDDGLGSVISQQAVSMARAKAKASGIAYVAVRRSNHYGAAARWAIQLAGDDMIGITGSNVEPLMCVTGGRSPGIGNNPFSYAFPTRSAGTICYDVACSQMAGGKLFDYRMRNTPVPPGCFLDSEGQPTTDPHAASLMVPFGGHKGYGLAVVVEMLSSVLAGGCFGEQMGSQYNLLDRPNHIAHYFVAIDISAFRPLEDYLQSADAFAQYLHNLPTAQGVDQIWLPGELENKSKVRKMEQGVLIQPQLADELASIGREAGLPEARTQFLKASPVEQG